MTAAASVNPHLETATPSWGSADASVAIVGVHGRTQSPDFIAELRDRIDVVDSYWVAPAAAGSSWYPYTFMHERDADDPWLAWSIDALDHALSKLREAGFGDDRIILLGFSQGACLTAHYVLSRAASFGGIVAFTGGYLGPDGTAPPSSGGDLDGTPALVTTIESDPWVPLHRTRETEQALRIRGARVTALVEPGEQHGVTDTAIALARRLIAEVAASPAEPPRSFEATI